MLRTIYSCPKPTMARVQGDVFAGGMGLVAACDMAVSVDTATYCLSEVKLGLIPATISPYVIRAMGARAAHRYFLTAERFSAAEAHRIGLVHEVVTPTALDAKVAELTQALTSASPNAVRSCKMLVNEVAGRDIDAVLIASHGGRHCRHPIQHRRQRGRAVVPAKAQARRQDSLVWIRSGTSCTA
jgi:methylglutaconyl-CoA hydratase